MNPLGAKPGRLDIKSVAGVVIISLVQEDGTIAFNIGLDADRAMALAWTIAQAAFTSAHAVSANGGGIIIAKGELDERIR